jgi:hypothetical protein
MMTLFYIKLSTNVLIYTLTPLYSHWSTPTCFKPQGTILREYWYISWAGATRKCPAANIRLKSSVLYVRCKYQIKEQCIIRYVEITESIADYYTLRGNIRLKSSVLYVMWKYQIKEQRIIRYVEISDWRAAYYTLRGNVRLKSSVLYVT